MIRPFTFVTLMLACTSGAYLFVVKHRSGNLDQQISSVTGQIRSAEQRIRVLKAEWALENDPSQLAALSKQFLALKPMAPDQLTTISKLAELLPPPGAGMPHLPLPPPPPWAVTPAAPDTDSPMDNGGGPIASAVPINAAPLNASLAAPAPAVAAGTTPAGPVRLAAARAKRPANSFAVQHGAAPPQRLAPPHPVRYAAHHSIPHLAVAAARPPLRMAPRLAAAQPYSYNHPVYNREAYNSQAYSRQAYHPASVGQRGAQSVFGSLGADLPPPQPVFRSPQ